MERDILFLIDDNLTNLLSGQGALSEKYEVYTANSAAKMFKLLTRKNPDIILLDIEMPEMNGYEALDVLKARPEYSHIPVILLTARDDIESEQIGFDKGARDYITKPFSIPRLLKRVETHIAAYKNEMALAETNRNLDELVRRRTKQLVTLQTGIISVLADMVESRDKVTGGHIERTETYLKLLVKEMIARGVYIKELGEDALGCGLDMFLAGAQLHDIGKISISDCILNKPGRLTDEEFEIIKNHTKIGEDMVKRIEKKTSGDKFLDHARLFAASHHEKWDGTGYPRGVSGTNIPLQGRIMAIVDVYDALVSERPYKKPFTHEEAISIIKEGRGMHFDPLITDVFLSIQDKVLEVKESAFYNNEKIEDRTYG